MNEIAKGELAGNKAQHACIVGAYPQQPVAGQQTMHEIAVQRSGRTVGVPFVESAMAVPDIDAQQGAHQQLMVVPQLQTGHEVMREIALATAFLVVRDAAVFQSVAQQSHIGAYPQLVAPPQDIGDILVRNVGCQGGRGLGARQLTVRHGIAVDAAVDRHPQAAVALNIGGGHGDGPETVGHRLQVLHLTVGVEAQTTDLTVGNHPYLPLTVAEGAHRGGRQQTGQLCLCLHIARQAFRRLLCHRGEVQHIGALFHADPQPVETVLAEAAARTAAQRESWRSHTQLQGRVTVEAHQTAYVRGYPDKPETVFQHVGHRIAGQSRLHVEQRHIIVLPHGIVGLGDTMKRTHQYHYQQYYLTHFLSVQGGKPPVKSSKWPTGSSRAEVPSSRFKVMSFQSMIFVTKGYG